MVCTRALTANRSSLTVRAQLPAHARPHPWPQLSSCARTARWLCAQSVLSNAPHLSPKRSGHALGPPPPPPPPQAMRSDSGHAGPFPFSLLTQSVRDPAVPERQYRDSYVPPQLHPHRPPAATATAAPPTGPPPRCLATRSLSGGIPSRGPVAKLVGPVTK